jgi:hypothetical protein
VDKADVHAESSAKKFGGEAGDYQELHEFMDSSKAFLGDNRHRALFHSTAGVYYMQKIFGVDFKALEALMEKYSLPEGFISDFLALLAHNRAHGVHLLNSKGDKVHVRSVAEQHILEDFRQKFVPTMQDYFGNMKLLPWMDNAMGPLGTAGESSAAGKTTVKAIAVD